jgi:uncharacterized protein with NRDE domain
MCTLIVLHRCEEEAPLLAAANRDEYLDRPSSGLALRRAGGRLAVAPHDLRAGGAWLGVNEAGVFAGLTNRPATRDESRRSRGGLVMEALACGSALEAARRLEQVSAAAYNPFNCLVADGREAFVAVYEDKPAVAALRPGVHVIGNADPDDRRNLKVARLLERAEAAAEHAPEDRLAALASICRSHEGSGGPLGSPCVHAGSYGTRSSTLLRLARDPARSVLRHADGPPCETAHEDQTELLRELHREGQACGAEANDARRER